LLQDPQWKINSNQDYKMYICPLVTMNRVARRRV
jgi:hypothetical protein